MKLLLLIAAVLFTGALALKDGQVCEPGSAFKEDCNTCRCSADGTLKSCTRKFCVPEVQGDDPKAQPEAEARSEDVVEKEEEAVHTNGQVCVPNEVKMEDCNRCKCAANGIGWFCTRKACPPREKRDTGAHQRPQQQCTPGTTFKSADGCNNCFCTETGIAACTQKFCFGKVKREATKVEKQCEPNTSFKSADGCNDCFCTENGIAACTMKFCFSEPAATKVKRKAVQVQKQCEPGTSFKSADGCNDCFCTETGIAACTMKFCFGKVKRDTAQKVEKQCEPGTSFKSADGCNDCFCTETGIAACTMKFCFFEKVKRAAPQQQQPQKCVPGTKFRDAEDCNDCFCTETGHAVCTEKLCLKRKRSTDNAELPQSKTAPGTPGFTCEPSKAFKFQCNTCRCDTTGTSAACTYKFCLPGEY